MVNQLCIAFFNQLAAMLLVGLNGIAFGHDRAAEVIRA
jgi:hypothetical protein